jgi:ribosome-associated protein
MVDDLEKSRTRLKKEAIARQKMGEKLVLLSDDQLNRMNLPAALLEAIQSVRTITSHGARRRQMQYVGVLMRRVDAKPIEQALTAIDQGDYQRAKAFHRIEAWRDQLVGGNDEVIHEIINLYPDADRQRLWQLVRSARKAVQNNAPRKSARHLFRYLNALTAADE